MIVTILFRRGSAGEWTLANRVLRDGEPGYETDTGLFKIGDGVRPWRNLPYANASDAVAAVASVNQRVNDLTTQVAAGDLALSDAITALTESTDSTFADIATFRVTTEGALSSLSMGKQNVDPNLTAITTLSPSDDDILQRKSGSWVNRTIVQLKTDLSLTKSDVGLSQADNTSDANKPISTATAAALAGKEPTITATDSSQYYRGDKTMQPLNKTAVGLSNVDNTSDANKPISTAQQTALDNRVRFDAAQTLTSNQQAQGQANLGALGEGKIVMRAEYYGVLAGNSAAINTTNLTSLSASAATLGLAILLPPGNIPVNAFTLQAPLFGASRTKTTLVVSGTVTVNVNGVSIKALTLKSAAQTAISAANIVGFTMQDVQIDYDATVTTNWLALDAYNVDRLRIHDCRLRIGGLQLSLCDDFLIEGNYIDCEYVNTNEPCHISGQSSGQFVNNSVYRTLTDGVDLFSSGHRCVIANNRFIGLRGASGIECKVTMSDDPGNTSSPDNLFEATIIANNVLYDFNPPTGNATRSGIFAEYVDNRAVPAFSIAETNRAIIITGNVLQDFNVIDPGAGSTVSYWGIVYTGHNGLITNNVIRNMRNWQSATPVGIRLAAPLGSKCVGVRVAGNNIVGVQGSTGILVGNLERCQIDDNIIRQDDVTGIAPKFGVGITAGKTLTECSISNNTFECNVTNSFGIRGESSSSVLTGCRVQGNTFRDCGIQLYAVQKTSFLGNTLDNATNSQAFSVGVSGVSSRGNTYNGNHLTLSSDYGLILTDCDGFVINNNSFQDTARAILLVGNTRKGVVVGNLSINQTLGTEFPHYSGVSAGDQATTIVSSNRVNDTVTTDSALGPDTDFVATLNAALA